ncbi:MAG: DNA primase, partial [Alphaproteobacteria bacterium]|nr:DNA primase [Alphaproteobacteria bacterium]
MSLPPGFLDELRTRVSLSSVVGRKVTWDMRKSNQGKGDMWAPCPFHQEKSASFHVDDRKGYYYCFGCHAKGDALTFIKEIENLGFMEAVEVLAREAGMPMPERDPRAAQVADRRTQLIAVMEEAVKWFRLQLKTSAAAEARAYLAKRGLTEAAQDRWDIGFAPDQRQALFAALSQKGFAADLIVAAGVCAKPDDGGAPYDRFRGRIIFPIRDGRGRAISLGGRAMDPNARAKYLNGPETEIFDKGRNLYNHAPAREAAGKGKPLIVAEGYMDVIALCEAGFSAAVAPLGTAVTEDQLRLMWRIHDEPIIALDGDAAGIRAALRVVDLALPLLEAGKGLRFAVLPGGQDPDDLIKSQGAGAMQGVLDAAQPMVRLLWQRETEGRVFDSPERRAALDKSLRAALKRIADPSIRTHYGEDIKRLRLELFGQGGVRVPAFRGARFVPKGTPLPASASARQSLLAQGHAVEEVLREAVILASLILHPGLIHRFESALERLDLTGEDHSRLRALLLAHADEDAASLAEILRVEAGGALDALMRRPHVQIAPPLRNPADLDLATLCLAEE